MIKAVLILALMTFLHSHNAPNIIYILVDDVGWADFNYNVNGNTSIPTPNIDRLAAQGIKLKSHYVQPTCTPSRASLMTGRYAVNTGLSFSMFPNCPFGLPDDMPTMPQLLKKAGYSTHMVGNWHLGYSKWKQTPIAKGFESFTGSLAWGLDSYDKSIWKTPWELIGIDWMEAYQNKSFRHRIDNQHVTTVITQESIKKIKDHSKENPLFLYTSFTAPHSPLQPDPESAKHCQHIPHLWRRQYCGMVVGLDTAIGQIHAAAQEKLGSNTVIVVSSDNGGSVWFGGLNQPLRSGKANYFEGGVRVPAFALDLSGKYLGQQQKEFHHKIHISDWLPTFLSWADAQDLTDGLSLDGIDQSEALVTDQEARTDVFLELFTTDESHDGTQMVAYIKGKYKLIQGDTRDPHYYRESTEDFVNTTDATSIPRIPFENAIRFFDYVFGETKNEMLRTILSGVFLFDVYASRLGPQTYLFDLEKDMNEENNIAEQYPDIVQDILETAQLIKDKSPPQQKYYMMDSSELGVYGDCSESSVPDHLCRFVHPWIDDGVDLTSLKLEHGAEMLVKEFKFYLGVISMFVIILMMVVYVLCCRASSGKRKSE